MQRVCGRGGGCQEALVDVPGAFRTSAATARSSRSASRSAPMLAMIDARVGGRTQSRATPIWGSRIPVTSVWPPLRNRCILKCLHCTISEILRRSRTPERGISQQNRPQPNTNGSAQSGPRGSDILEHLILDYVGRTFLSLDSAAASGRVCSDLQVIADPHAAAVDRAHGQLQRHPVCAGRRLASSRRGRGRPRAVPAFVAARIRAEYEADGSLGAIARSLDADGVRTAQGGRRWWPSTVRSVLVRSEVLRG
jgi:hypothetical protein